MAALSKSVLLGLGGLLAVFLVGSALGNLAAGQRPPDPVWPQKVVYFEQTI